MPRYIDADEALLELDKELVSDEFNYAVRAISRVKTADVVERKMGMWINDDGLYRCSSCGKLWAHWWANAMPPERLYKEMKYCPRCGAEMREEQQDG